MRQACSNRQESARCFLGTCSPYVLCTAFRNFLSWCRRPTLLNRDLTSTAPLSAVFTANCASVCRLFALNPEAVCSPVWQSTLQCALPNPFRRNIAFIWQACCSAQRGFLKIQVSGGGGHTNTVDAPENSIMRVSHPLSSNYHRSMLDYSVRNDCRTVQAK